MKSIHAPRCLTRPKAVDIPVSGRIPTCQTSFSMTRGSRLGMEHFYPRSPAGGYSIVLFGVRPLDVGRLACHAGSLVNLPLLYLITFLESIGTGILQRGIYFYTHERLGFGQLGNLLAALAYGAVYVAGALKSHAAATRWGERNLMMVTLVGLLILHAS